MIGSRIALDSAADHVGNDVHGAHIRMPFRRLGIDRNDVRVRVRRTQQPRMQHAGELDVDGEARGASHLGAPIDPRDRLADDGKTIVRRQRRRLVRRNLAFNFTD